MESSEHPVEDKQKRVFATPLAVPLSIMMVSLIYFGYVHIIRNNGLQNGIIVYLESISFDVFLAFELGLITIILYNRHKMSSFFKKYPAIENETVLEILKPIIRTNMYSALISVPFIAVVTLTALMVVFKYNLVESSVVAILWFSTAIMQKEILRQEEQLKQIECTDEELESELYDILQCWLHKPFPDF